MYAECSADWNQLALSWDLFESRGLTPVLLQHHLSTLPLPIGVIGCGRGLILRQIAEFNPAVSVTGFDTSSEMINQARARGHVNAILVAADEVLPRDFTAGSVIIVTGVLDPFEPPEIQQFLRTVRSRLQTGGTLLLGAFCQPNPLEDLARVARATHPLGVVWPKVIDWALANGADPRAGQVIEWLQAIALARGVTLPNASAWLKSVLPQVRRHFDPVDLTTQLSAAGFGIHSIQSHVDAGVAIIRALSEG